MADISQLLKSTGTKVQNSAQFGAAVEDFTRGNLGFKPATGQSIDPNRSKDDPHTWVSTSYAAALAGGAGFRPKLKFMFKVEFVFTQEALNLYPELRGQDFTFMIQYVDRPKVEFEYEEDINQYNFRTKVLKKITHRELTVKFLDDTGNRVFDFFRIMMFLNSPITRGALKREQTNTPPNSADIESQLINGTGMAFTAAGGGGFLDNAHRGVINGSVGGVGGSIAAIRVKQIFIGSNTSTDGTATIKLKPQEVIFDFMNPRIRSFDLDELSHDANDPNVLTMVFDYDWMEMLKVAGGLPENDTPSYKNIKSPGAQTAPTDVSAGGAGGSSPAGNGGIFGNIIKGRLGGVVQQITSTAVNRAVKSIAGGGFLGGVASTMANGLVNTASNNLLNGVLTSSLKTGSAGAAPPAASDNTGSGGVKSSVNSLPPGSWAGGVGDTPPF